MRFDPRIAMALALSLTLGLAGCEQGDGTDGDGTDTLDVRVPEDAGERLEEAGRDVGEAVGEGMEEAGGALERAGQEVQEEMREGGAEEDTVRM